MEEITWVIYKKIRATGSFLLAVLAFIMGWFLQNKFEIKINDDAKELFSVIAQSLVALVALVGVMVVFGFEGIRSKYVSKSEQSKEQVQSDVDGWALGSNKFLKFGVYSFLVVVLNLFLIIFLFPDNIFMLAFLLSDIVLVGYSFRLVICLAEKTMGIDNKILDSLKALKDEP